MRVKVSDKIVKKLIEHQVDVVFEYPGGNIAPILDSIKRKSNIQLLLTRNDQAASLMADGYARVTGKVGVCMATVGPGATNLVTGIANAYYDSIPMVCITGQVGLGSFKGIRDTRQLGFQEADIVSMVKPITKWAYMVKKPGEIGTIIDQAFRTAKEGRPGPVLIDIPIDVQRMELEEEDFLEEQEYSFYKSRPNPQKIERLAQRISEAKKPVLIAGGGVVLSDAEDELHTLATKYQIPVANTLMGIGSFDQDSPLSLGFMGCYGSRWCNKAVVDADLVIGVGNRFDLRAIGTETKQFEENKYIAHIDIDPAEINNRVNVDVGIYGDAKQVLNSLLQTMEEMHVQTDTSPWMDTIGEWKKRYNLNEEYRLAEKYEKVRPAYIIQKITQILNGEGIVTSDVGQNQMWTAQFMKRKKPGTFLTSGGLGNMGYGLPAALAAKFARPDQVVVNITGDGSFQMNVQELATARAYQLPIKIFILHNRTLGLVKQFQDKTFEGKATSTELDYNPDFMKIAQAYDAVGLSISTPEGIDSVVEQAFGIQDKTVIVDCRIDPGELAIPEIEGGHTLDDAYPYLNHRE